MHETIDMTVLAPMLKTVGAGIAWGIWRYANNRAKSGEPFDGSRFGSTVVVAALIGVMSAAAGNPLDQATFSQQMAAYVPLIGIVDNVLSNLLRKYVSGDRLETIYNGFKFVETSANAASTAGFEEKVNRLARGEETEFTQADVNEFMGALLSSYANDSTPDESVGFDFSDSAEGGSPDSAESGRWDEDKPADYDPGTRR